MESRDLLTVIIFLTPVLWVASLGLYRVSPLQPLSHLPGPLLPRISNLWLTYHTLNGNEYAVVHSLHQQYGPIVRIGPNMVNISDGRALIDIYSARNGGFRKTSAYANFDFDGRINIFSARNPDARAPRAKAVAALFSTVTIRRKKHVLDLGIQKLVSSIQLEAESSKRTGEAVDILALTREFAVDIVRSYLFGDVRKCDNKKDTTAMHATTSAEGRKTNQVDAFNKAAITLVNTFLEGSPYWHLPNVAVRWIRWMLAKLKPEHARKFNADLALLIEYVGQLVDEAATEVQNRKHPCEGSTTEKADIQTFPESLLSAGISVEDVRAECIDLIFAGVHAVALTLSTITFHLARNPHMYERLRSEVISSTAEDIMEVESLSYLGGVIREGLRLTPPNPTRLPRVVPSPGWNFDGTWFPAGTEVSCSPLELHSNPTVFPAPYAFDPDRWTRPSETRAVMDQDFSPFGLGSRQCIARNLAMAEFFLAIKKIVEADCLAGARTCKDEIELLHYFNSQIVGGKIELRWN